ncbi:MAG TPA: Hsp20/alpha crystallin family protein [Gemmatimonadales bacterium]|nr:Hsp20/alpha crystallin family protein [Gemmatimonadales bacterium]
MTRWPAVLAGVPGSPWELMRRMSEEMDQLFESLGGTGSAQGRRRSTGLTSAAPMFVPNIEVQRRGNDLVVRADLPGMGPDDISVTVDRGALTISGERRQEQREEQGGVLRSEVTYGTFFRTIPLPDGVDENKVAAKFTNGVLDITIPVSQEREQGRRVQIKS